MIDFRYHLVSIIAILFALAVGIVLGAGPLKDEVDQGLTTQTAELRKENQNLRDQIAAGEQLASFEEAYAGGVAPLVLARRLIDRRVVVVVLPGADNDVVAGIRDRVTASGGRVAATVTIDDSWTAAESGAALDALAAQLVSSGTNLPEGDGWDRASAVLAAALVTSDAAQPAGGNTAAVLQAYQSAGFIGMDGDPTQRGTLVLTVAGPAATGDGAQREVGTVLALASALDSASRGEVVAGSPAAAGTDGVVGAIRDDAARAGAISTVDVADLVAGQQVAVLAAQEQESGQSGHYGAVDAPDGALPGDVVTAP